MTPPERLLTALGRGAPDRLPAMEMAISWRVVRDAGAADCFGLVERLDLDGGSANRVAYLLRIRGLLLRRARTFADPVLAMVGTAREAGRCPTSTRGGGGTT